MLPREVDLRRCADQDVEYVEAVQSNLFPRLLDAVEALYQERNEIDTRIRIYKDEHARIRVVGEAKASVELVCQRCMNPCFEELVATFDLVAVHSEAQAKALPKEYDAWLIEESANLHQLVEDELLLAMPMFAYHPEGECVNPALEELHQRAQESIAEEVANKPSPFAVLKSLK